MAEKTKVSRRDFLMTGVKTSAQLAAIAGTGLIGRPGRILGASDRVRVAVCGIRSWGFEHVKAYSKLANVEIAAVCDVDENVLKQRLDDMAKMGLPAPKTYIEFRKLLEDKSIDAISIATPNHWHSLMAIWSCQAGKDVFVEKPCSHSLWEGAQLVKAAQKYDRIVQHGTESRSAAGIIEGIRRIREGLLGELYMSRGLCFKWRDTIGHAAVEPVPPGVHYDLWTGPAPLKPFTRNRFHYNWHWIWDTGDGDLGNQGIHQLDVARWGLGVKLPNKVSAMGGHFMFDDDQETPNTLNCTFEFNSPEDKRKLLVFEVRHWMSNHEGGIGGEESQLPRSPAPTANAQSKSDLQSVAGPRRPRLGPTAGRHNTIGAIFYGAEGYMTLGGAAFSSYKTWMGEDHELGPRGQGEGDHFANFIDCVRSRRKEDLNAPIEEGHLSCALVHLANASYRLGRALNFDPASQQVIGDDEANRLLRGAYREPFIVPEKV
jgi:predicted dehydrogenase